MAVPVPLSKQPPPRIPSPREQMAMDQAQRQSVPAPKPPPATPSEEDEAIASYKASDDKARASAIEDAKRAGTYSDSAEFEESLQAESGARSKGIKKAELERVNALRAKHGLPPLTEEDMKRSHPGRNERPSVPSDMDELKKKYRRPIKPLPFATGFEPTRPKGSMFPKKTSPPTGEERRIPRTPRDSSLITNNLLKR